MSKPMTNKFTLEEMVMRVVGPIEPIGETHTDKDRLQNLENLLGLVDGLVFKIYQLQWFADRPEAAVAKIGKRARRFMDDLCE